MTVVAHAGGGKRGYHLTEPRIFWVILGRAFGPNEAKGHGKAIAIPVDDQQGKADAEKPGMMSLFRPLWARGWQGVEGFLAPPFHQQMDIPVDCLEHATKAPRRGRARGPAR